MNCSFPQFDFFTLAVTRFCLTLMAACSPGFPACLAGSSDGGHALSHQRAEDKPSKTIAFVNVAVLTMTNELALKRQTVLVNGGLIRAVGQADVIRVPADAVVIAGDGKFLMPGLCDMHAHLRKSDDEAILARYLNSGVTCIREMNGRPELLDWRQRIADGELVGPDLIIACPAIGNWSSPKSGYPTPTTREEGIQAVRQFAEQGYDWIKVYTFLPKEGFLGVVEEATKRGIPFGGHIPLDLSLGEASNSGLNSIEHLTGYMDATMTPQARKEDEVDLRAVFHAGDIDDQLLREAVNKTVLSGVWNCPTIVFFDRCLPTEMVEAAWSRFELRQQGYDNRRKIVRHLYEAGAKIVVGTDSDGNISRLPASVIVDELLALEEAGMSKWSVLRAATVNAAQMLGMSNSIGTVTSGMRANIILLNANPLEDLNNLRQPDLVMVGGHVVTSK